MKILDYIIPQKHQDNSFILSLLAYAEKNGKLTENQEIALRDCIDIEDDFFEYDVTPKNGKFLQDFNELKEKLARNRFKSIRNKNKCIRGIQSILNNKPNYGLIDKALCRDSYWG